MSKVIVTTVILISVFATATYLVMAWPFFLAVISIWMVWKASAYGWRLMQKDHIGQPRHIPNSL